VGVTRSAWKRALAEKLGADLTLDPSDAQLNNKLMNATGGRGPDLVIECAGSVETFATSIALVRPGGRIVQFGTMTVAQGALPFYSLYLKELTITNPRAAKSEDFPAAIELVDSGRVRLAPLVTDTFPLPELDTAIATTREGRSLKVILEHSNGQPS
jgi:threonine dehydrogenase-like Zn-dependent dehydrogenase